MKTSQNGIDLIKSFEGFRQYAYKCPAGVWTIGYGHTKGVSVGMAVTKARAEQLLREDLRWAEDAVNREVKVELNQNQFDALVSFVFNLGATNFHNSTLLRVVNSNPDDFAKIEEQFMRWDKSHGVRLLGLTKRRYAEYSLYATRLE
ncbi:MAG: lysozyme [Bacteroidales bacterium]|nr:lysozyme [Candidatus Egerieousia equi]